MGKWLDRVIAEMRTAEVPQLEPAPIPASTTRDLHDIHIRPSADRADASSTTRTSSVVQACALRGLSQT